MTKTAASFGFIRFADGVHRKENLERSNLTGQGEIYTGVASLF